MLLEGKNNSFMEEKQVMLLLIIFGQVIISFWRRIELYQEIFCKEGTKKSSC